MNNNDLFNQIATDVRQKKEIEEEEKAARGKKERDELDRKAVERAKVTADLLQKATTTLSYLYSTSELFQQYLQKLFKSGRAIHTFLPDYSFSPLSDEEKKGTSEKLGVPGLIPVGTFNTSEKQETRIILCCTPVQDTSNQAKELVIIRESPCFSLNEPAPKEFGRLAVELVRYEESGREKNPSETACAEGSKIEKALKELSHPTSALAYLFYHLETPEIHPTA